MAFYPLAIRSTPPFPTLGTLCLIGVIQVLAAWAVIPNVNIVDWVLVELRDAVNAASATKATAVAQLPAFILNNGNIVGLDGVSNLQFSNIITNNLFVVIYQRNHISIMSATAVPYASGCLHI